LGLVLDINKQRIRACQLQRYIFPSESLTFVTVMLFLLTDMSARVSAMSTL